MDKVMEKGHFGPFSPINGTSKIWGLSVFKFLQTFAIIQKIRKKTNIYLIKHSHNKLYITWLTFTYISYFFMFSFLYVKIIASKIGKKG